MPRRHGRNGALYVDLAGGGEASKVAFLNSWSISFTSDRVDVTAFGDSNKTYVAGLPDASGDFGGFWDSDQNDLYTAAVDGVARKFYLYPDETNDASDYWFGEAFFDFGASSSVDGAASVSGSFAASSAISRNSA